MKKTITLKVINLFPYLLMLLLITAPVCALDIVKNGKPVAVIVIPADAGIYQKQAALELKKYLKKISGADLRIVAENRLPAAPAYISIGHTKLAAKAGISTAGLKKDWRRLVVKGKVLYLLGRDQKPLQTRPALSPLAGAQGTFAAVAVFLRDVLGCRWFEPCPMGVYIPKMQTVSVPNNLDITSKPDFVFYHVFGREMVGSYANNCRMTCRKKLFGCHTWDNLFNYRQWAEKHPEFYAVGTDGNRIKQRSHLCTSNPELNRLFVKILREMFDQGYDEIQLGQSDGWHGCNCAKCKQIDSHQNCRTVTRDNPCEKIYRMHNWIVRELAKSHPEKKIQLVLYTSSLWPSKQDNRPYTNVTGMFCPLPISPKPLSAMDEMSGQCLDDWKKKNVTEFTEYQYFFDNLINPLALFPEVSPEWLKAKMKWNLARGVTCSGGRVICLGWPMMYTCFKMAENPDLDPAETIGEFCRFIYGAAAPEMEEFYQKFYRNAGKVWLNRAKIFATRYPAEAAFTTSWTPAEVRELNQLLGKAEAKADSVRSKGFLRKVRYEFDGFRYLAGMLFAKKEFEAAKTMANLMKVKQQVDNFEKWRQQIFSLYASDRTFLRNFWPDYEVLTVVLMSGGRSWGPPYHKLKLQLPAAAKGEVSFRGRGIGSHLSHSEISEPLTWDFPRLFRMLSKTGDTTETCRVGFTRTAPDRAGKIDFKIWNKLPAISLVPFRGLYKASKATGTQVKLCHDTSKLYILYECAEPYLPGLKTYTGPRDGRVYGADSVELFLDPKCVPDKMFQFIVSPAANAVFDAACDFTIDAANPNKPPKNPRWNCKWSYLYALDKSGKRWFIQLAIPFASLGETTPSAGAVWLANFARNRYANLKTPEMSSWIPATFGDNPGTFGKLIFAGKNDVKD